jgi:hypothetical protein
MDIVLDSLGGALIAIAVISALYVIYVVSLGERD